MKASRTECIATLLATILFSLGMHCICGVISITLFNQIILLLIYIITSKNISNLPKIDFSILLLSCIFWAIELCHGCVNCIKDTSIIGAIFLILNVLELAFVYNKFIIENCIK